MPKYLIKATVVFHYELEAKNHKEAVSQGFEGHNLEIHEFLRDVIESEATELDDTWQGLDSIPDPNA
jgi:hypothetical protein